MLQTNQMFFHKYQSNGSENNTTENLKETGKPKQIKLLGKGAMGEVHLMYIDKSTIEKDNKYFKYPSTFVRKIPQKSYSDYLKLEIEVSMQLKTIPVFNTFFRLPLIYNDLSDDFLDQEYLPCQIDPILLSYLGRDQNIITPIIKQGHQFIDFLYYYGFEHKDVKPDNIMYCPHDQKFVLIDWGLSNIVQNKLSSSQKNRYSGDFIGNAGKRNKEYDKNALESSFLQTFINYGIPFNLDGYKYTPGLY